jgi:hypothetical protein
VPAQAGDYPETIDSTNMGAVELRLTDAFITTPRAHLSALCDARPPVCLTVLTSPVSTDHLAAVAQLI